MEGARSNLFLWVLSVFTFLMQGDFPNPFCVQKTPILSLFPRVNLADFFHGKSSGFNIFLLWGSGGRLQNEKCLSPMQTHQLMCEMRWVEPTLLRRIDLPTNDSYLVKPTELNHITTPLLPAKRFRRCQQGSAVSHMYLIKDCNKIVAAIWLKTPHMMRPTPHELETPAAMYRSVITCEGMFRRPFAVGSSVGESVAYAGNAESARQV